MPISFNIQQCLPTVIDTEYILKDEEKVAELVGKIILGHCSHVKRILAALATTAPAASKSDLQLAIKKLSPVTPDEIQKRDGWVFQILSWLASFTENSGKRFFCQPPHDAPAQHGLDGLSVILSSADEIEAITITEDKCTNKHRTILPTVWEEFSEYEKGTFNNKVMTRVTYAIEHLDYGSVLEKNKNDIYKKNLWRYRVGINRAPRHSTPSRRKALFKGYDECVKGDKPFRRYASTILTGEDVRVWMDAFCKKVIAKIEEFSTDV